VFEDESKINSKTVLKVHLFIVVFFQWWD